MTACLLVNGDWLLTPQRVAIHVPTKTAVVADLHLGYDVVRLWGGDAVPAVSLEEQLAPLGWVFAEHAIGRLIVAGDLVESGRCQELIPGFRAWLRDKGVHWAGLAAGNHDLGLVDVPIYPDGLALQEWTVVHGDGALPAGRVVQGHVHPYLRLTSRVFGPCYLVCPEHIVLPAYSGDAAGLNIVGVRRWRDYRCCVIAGSKVLDLGQSGDLRRRMAVR